MKCPKLHIFSVHVQSFFVTVVLLVLVSVQLSYELSRHEMRIRRLAEEVALLRDEIKKARLERDDN